MYLKSKTIQLRLVEENDADFILKLRLDDRYKQFLSQVNPDLEAQKAWILSYKIDEVEGLQYYFIIERLDGTPCGTVRIYDIKEESFCWGSWILNEDKTKYAAIESAFLVYKFGFEQLGFKKSHFDVMKDNSLVVNFHRKMGAQITHEDSDNFYFIISDEDVEVMKHKLKDKIK